MNDYARYRMRDRGFYTDRTYGDERDYAKNRSRYGRRDYGDYESGEDMRRIRRDYDMAEDMRGSRRYNREYMGDSMYERDYDDYGDYADDYEMDGGHGRQRETYIRTDLDGRRRRSTRTGRYMRDRATGDYATDFAMAEKKLSRSDMEEWKKSLENADGTKGEHFPKEHAEQVARNMGISIDRYGKEEFVMAMNMIYADYCKVAQKFGMNKPEFYAEMAQAFMDDKDFDGDGKEKLMLYYKCIVEKDD